jgi:microcystin-dependent protein
MPLHGHAYRASLTNQSSASCYTSGGFMHSTSSTSNRGPYTGTPTNSIGVGGSGGSQAHSIMSPVSFINFQVKL